MTLRFTDEEFHSSSRKRGLVAQATSSIECVRCAGQVPNLDRKRPNRVLLPRHLQTNSSPRVEDVIVGDPDGVGRPVNQHARIGSSLLAGKVCQDFQWFPGPTVVETAFHGQINVVDGVRRPLNACVANGDQRSLSGGDQCRDAVCADLVLTTDKNVFRFEQTLRQRPTSRFPAAVARLASISCFSSYVAYPIEKSGRICALTVL